MTAPACVLRTDYTRDSECGQEAAYRIHGVDCYVCCDLTGSESCLGHLVCPDHAAKLRTESVAQVPARARKKNVPAFTVERIYSVNGGSTPNPTEATDENAPSPSLGNSGDAEL